MSSVNCLILSVSLAAPAFAGARSESSVEAQMDSCAGRKSHLAVVNQPVAPDDGSILSLRGTWEFAPFRRAGE